MDNIPKGYDENGVRSGVGKWEEGIWSDIECEDIDPIEDLFLDDRGEDLENPETVQCYRCGAIVSKLEATAVDYGTGHICQRCADDMDIY